MCFTRKTEVTKILAKILKFTRKIKSIGHCILRFNRFVMKVTLQYDVITVKSERPNTTLIVVLEDKKRKRMAKLDDCTITK